MNSYSLKIYIPIPWIKFWYSNTMLKINFNVCNWNGPGFIIRDPNSRYGNDGSQLSNVIVLGGELRAIWVGISYA